MQVLELVHGGELGDIQPIGQDTVRLPLQQVLTLVGRDVGNGCEDVTGVSCSTLYAVSVVDTALSCLSVNVEPLQIVVEIHGSGT